VTGWKAVEKIVAMFGSLHIEMAALETVGDWLEGSGWAEALVQAQIVTEGMANKKHRMLCAQEGLTELQLLPYIFCSIVPMTTTVLHVQKMPHWT